MRRHAYVHSVRVGGGAKGKEYIVWYIILFTHECIIQNVHAYVHNMHHTRIYMPANTKQVQGMYIPLKSLR